MARNLLIGIVIVLAVSCDTTSETSRFEEQVVDRSFVLDSRLHRTSSGAESVAIPESGKRASEREAVVSVRIVSGSFDFRPNQTFELKIVQELDLRTAGAVIDTLVLMGSYQQSDYLLLLQTDGGVEFYGVVSPLESVTTVSIYAINDVLFDDSHSYAYRFVLEGKTLSTLVSRIQNDALDDLQLTNVLTFVGWCEMPCWSGRVRDFESYYVRGTLSFTANNYQFELEAENRAIGHNEVLDVIHYNISGTYQRRGGLIHFSPQTADEFLGVFSNNELRVVDAFSGLFQSKDGVLTAKFRSDRSSGVTN